VEEQGYLVQAEVGTIDLLELSKLPIDHLQTLHNPNTQHSFYWNETRLVSGKITEFMAVLQQSIKIRF